MTTRLPDGSKVRLMWGAFDATTGAQLVRWDMRRDKVISIATRLRRAGHEGEMLLKGQRFLTPPRDTLTPAVTDAPSATPPGPGLDNDAAVARADHPCTQFAGGAPEPAVGAEAPAATSLP